MIIIAITVTAFLGGVIVGVVALLRAGISREESDHSLRGGPQTRTATATRRVIGLYVRTPPGGTRVDGTEHQAETGLVRRTATILQM
jgi:hypothetical protein